MLGPIPKVFGDTCYVRSNRRDSRRHLLWLGPIQKVLGDTCYVRSNSKGSWRHLLCQFKSKRVLTTLVMLGQIQEGFGDTCYVRSNLRGFGRHLLCQVQSQRFLETLVMLVPIPKVLGDTCYVRSNLGETFCNLVMLGPFMGNNCYPQVDFDLKNFRTAVTRFQDKRAREVVIVGSRCCQRSPLFGPFSGRRSRSKAFLGWEKPCPFGYAQADFSLKSAQELQGDLHK